MLTVRIDGHGRAGAPYELLMRAPWEGPNPADGSRSHRN